MQDEYYTPAEVAQKLRVSTDTLVKWREKGEGPPWVSMGARTARYPIDHLEAWIDRNKNLGDLEDDKGSNEKTPAP